MFFPPWNSQRKTHPKLPNSGCVVPHTKGGEQPGRRRTQSRIPVKHQPSLFCRLLVWNLQVVNPKKLSSESCWKNISRSHRVLAAFGKNKEKRRYHPRSTFGLPAVHVLRFFNINKNRWCVANHPLLKGTGLFPRKPWSMGFVTSYWSVTSQWIFDHKLKIWSHLGSMERPLRSR